MNTTERERNRKQSQQNKQNNRESCISDMVSISLTQRIKASDVADIGFSSPFMSPSWHCMLVMSRT